MTETLTSRPGDAAVGSDEPYLVVEDRVETHGSAGRGLEVREVFEARTGAAGEFLRAGQVFTGPVDLAAPEARFVVP